MSKIDLNALETKNTECHIHIGTINELIKALREAKAALLAVEEARDNDCFTDYAQQALANLDARFDFGDESGGE